MNSGIGIALGELVREFGGTLIGDPGIVIRGIRALAQAGDADVSFLSDSKHRAQLDGTRAAAVILAPADQDATTRPRIVTPNPYAYMAKVSARLHPAPQPAAGVHPSAVVDASARLAADVSVGAHAVIGARAEIGEGVVVAAGCVIGDGVAVGAATRLYPQVTIYSGCRLGARCIVHAGVVIGADGFGFAPEQGRWLKIPQIGRVVIGDDVEIGANTTIDRGAFEDTVIEDGVKLDNQIQIAHNVRIGAHTAIAACVGIAGSTTIGRHCMIGGAAMLNGHIRIADGVTIMGATSITKSIDAPGAYSSTWAAAPQREWLKMQAQWRRLEALAKRVGELEQALQDKERNTT